MADIKGINGANGIGRTGGPQQPDTYGNEFKKIFQEKIGDHIPDENNEPPAYSREEEFFTDLKEVLQIVSPVIEKVVNAASNNGLSPLSA